jgi:hypothetical protein
LICHIREGEKYFIKKGSSGVPAHNLLSKDIEANNHNCTCPFFVEKYSATFIDAEE